LGESPRQSCRVQGKPPKYTPNQLDKIKTERSKSIGSKASKEPKTLIILQAKTIETEVNPSQEVEPGLVHSGPKITNVVQTESDTS